MSKYGTGEASFKRPDHTDFMTTSELVKARFSGVRDNSITLNYEVWMVGEIVATVSHAQIEINKNALTEAILKSAKIL